MHVTNKQVEKDESVEKLEIKRTVLTKRVFDSVYQHSEVKSTEFRPFKDKFRLELPTLKSVCKTFNKRVPGFKFIKNYEWKQNLLSDFVAGLTVTVMQVTQGSDSLQSCLPNHFLKTKYSRYVGWSTCGSAIGKWTLHVLLCRFDLLGIRYV
jgi:hypothetical protein